MEIGLTWNNKLVCNKEMKVNKSDMKTVGVLAVTGLGIGMAIGAILPAIAYVDRVFDIIKIAEETILHIKY